MNWIYGIFGMFLTGYALQDNSRPATGMRPYEAVIGAVLMVVAMVLAYCERRAEDADLRSRLGGRTE